MKFRAFLYNLPTDMTDQEIAKEIEKQSNVDVQVKVIKDSLGKNAGKAEVKFNTKQEMRDAISKMHIIGKMGNKVIKMREFDSKHEEILNSRFLFNLTISWLVSNGESCLSPMKFCSFYN